MDYEDLITTIVASVILLALVAVCLVWFFKYGLKQIEIELKCRKAQFHFYESASKLIDKDLNEDGNKLSN